VTLLIILGAFLLGAGVGFLLFIRYCSVLYRDAKEIAYGNVIAATCGICRACASRWVDPAYLVAVHLCPEHQRICDAVSKFEQDNDGWVTLKTGVKR
jgi:predicted RNA methylase